MITKSKGLPRDHRGNELPKVEHDRTIKERKVKGITTKRPGAQKPPPFGPTFRHCPKPFNLHFITSQRFQAKPTAHDGTTPNSRQIADRRKASRNCTTIGGGRELLDRYSVALCFLTTFRVTRPPDVSLALPESRWITVSPCSVREAPGLPR